MNYRNITVAGSTLQEWLQGVTNDSSLVQDRMAWILMHTCFAFYHICGPFLFPDDFELIMIVVGRYHEDHATVMGPQFFVYLYGYVMGRYRHIYPEERYHVYIQHVIEQLSEG